MGIEILNLQTIKTLIGLITVISIQEWLESRKNESSAAEHLKVVHPYDWTFTTDYSGMFTHLFLL